MYSIICASDGSGLREIIQVQTYHTFVEIDHEIISKASHLPYTDSFKKSCCQLQAKVCAQITG